MTVFGDYFISSSSCFLLTSLITHVQRLLVGGRVEEAATVLARHVGDIDEAVEVAAAAGAAAV